MTHEHMVFANIFDPTRKTFLKLGGVNPGERPCNRIARLLIYQYMGAVHTLDMKLVHHGALGVA